MAEEEIRHPDGRIEHPGVRSEKTDASFRWILALLLGSMVLAAIIFAALLWFFHDYNDYQTDLRKSPYPLAPQPSDEPPPPPEPRLEQIDRLKGIQKPNVYVREASKEAVLNSYGPTHLPGPTHLVGQALGAQGLAPVGGPVVPAVQVVTAAEVAGSPALAVVHIPIGRAMRHLAGNLPARTERPDERRANGLVDAGQSNSGRLYRGKVKWSAP